MSSPFTIAEYRARLARLQGALQAAGCDLLLLTERGSIAYVTGMQNGYLSAFFAALVAVEGDPVLLASDFEMPNATLTSWCEDRVCFRVADNPLEKLSSTLAARGWDRCRLGVEMRSLRADQFAELRGRLAGAHFSPAERHVDGLRSIKSEAELACLRESARLTDLGIQAAFAEARAGQTENDLAAAAFDAMVRGGSEYPAIDPIVTAGRRSGVPHTTFCRGRLAAGDSVLVELGASIHRYTAPLFRTIALTPVPAEVQRAAEACRAALDVLIAHIRPGAVARDVAYAARQAWSPLCDELVWHGIYAYSVGLGFPPDWNDTPLCVTEASEEVLRPGMCFHATTSLRKTHEFGVALSETVAVTADGCEVLTRVPRRLHVVE